MKSALIEQINDILSKINNIEPEYHLFTLDMLVQNLIDLLFKLKMEILTPEEYRACELSISRLLNDKEKEVKFVEKAFNQARKIK